MIECMVDAVIVVLSVWLLMIVTCKVNAVFVSLMDASGGDVFLCIF